MEKLRVALFCRADIGKTDEIMCQLNELEKYSSENNMDVVAAFLDESTGDIDLQNEVHFQMLCAAKQKVFFLILVEELNIFPCYEEKNIPKLQLYSIKERVKITIGLSDDFMFDTIPTHPNKSTLYYRDSCEIMWKPVEKQENF